MAPPNENRRSPRRKSEVKSDPYDITQDAEIIEETVRETISRRASQQRKKNAALNKARESMIVRTNACKQENMEVETGKDDPLAVNENGDFLCATCPRAFKSLLGRQRHVAKCATSTLPDGICPCCSVDMASAHSKCEINPKPEKTIRKIVERRGKKKNNEEEGEIP